MAKKQKWTKKSVMLEAKNYQTRGEFLKGNGTAYRYAKENGMLDKLFPFKKDQKKAAIPATRGRKRIWTKETCYAEAQKYTTLSEFRTNAPSAMDIAYKNGWLNEYTWLAKARERAKSAYTLDDMIGIRNQYPNKSMLAQKKPSVYKALKTQGFLNAMYPVHGNTGKLHAKKQAETV